MNKHNIKVGQQIFCVNTVHRGSAVTSTKTVTKVGKQYFYLAYTSYVSYKISLETLREWYDPKASNGSHTIQCYLTEAEYRGKLELSQAKSELMELFRGFSGPKLHSSLTAEDLRNILKTLKEGKQ